jgi:Uma2 family endonuclease
MAFSIDERRHSFTFEEYLAIAERSAARVEYWEGVILDMSGGTPRHSALCANLMRVLGNQLRGKPCRAYDANLRVRSVTANRATYADVTVICGALELDPADKTSQTVLNPAVLVEVLSPSTERDDRGAKLDSYKTIASVQAVVLVAPHGPEVIVHARNADGSWSESRHQDGAFQLVQIGCRIAISEIYEDLPD